MITELKMLLVTWVMNCLVGSCPRCAICSCRWVSDESAVRSEQQICSLRLRRWSVSRRRPTSWESWSRSGETKTPLRNRYNLIPLSRLVPSVSPQGKRPHLWFLVWCVSSGVAENEADIFGELHWVFIVPCRKSLRHGAKIHGRVNDVPIVLRAPTKRRNVFLTLLTAHLKALVAVVL